MDAHIFLITCIVLSIIFGFIFILLIDYTGYLIRKLINYLTHKE